MLSVLAAYDVGEDLLLDKSSEFSRLSELRVGEGFFEVESAISPAWCRMVLHYRVALQSSLPKRNGFGSMGRVHQRIFSSGTKVPSLALDAGLA